MVGEATLDEYKAAYREVVKEEGKKIFKIHLGIYIVVNVILIYC